MTNKITQSVFNSIVAIAEHPWATITGKPLSGGRARTDLDAAVIEGFMLGEEAAFAKVHSRFRKPILQYVKQRVPHDEAAEEITQEIFLKVHRYRESFDPSYAFSTWLWTIARNTIIDWQRSHSRMNQAKQTAFEDEPSIEEVPCRRPNAERALLTRAKRRVLFTLFKQLSRVQRRVLWMRLIHQASYDEIAEKLDMSLAAVKCALYRAKQVMQVQNAALGL